MLRTVHSVSLRNQLGLLYTIDDLQTSKLSPSFLLVGCYLRHYRNRYQDHLTVDIYWSFDKESTKFEQLPVEKTCYIIDQLTDNV